MVMAPSWLACVVVEDDVVVLAPGLNLQMDVGFRWRVAVADAWLPLALPMHLAITHGG